MFEAKEATLRAAKRRYEAKRQARQDSAANLGVEWNRPGFTLEQKQAAIAQSLTAVIIHPAPTRARGSLPTRSPLSGATTRTDPPVMREGPPSGQGWPLLSC